MLPLVRRSVVGMLLAVGAVYGCTRPAARPETSEPPAGAASANAPTADVPLASAPTASASAAPPPLRCALPFHQACMRDECSDAADRCRAACQARCTACASSCVGAGCADTCEHALDTCANHDCIEVVRTCRAKTP